MFKLKRLQIIFCAALAGVLVSGCSEEPLQEAPMQMPVKENTWVRTETVKKTKDQFFALAGKQLAALPVDAGLAKKLKSLSTSQSTINNKKECLARANALDVRRTAVQKRGGVWHAFERVSEAKKYSDYGMQLDSQMNRLVYSLKHICKSAKGLPLNGWGRGMVAHLEQEGKEKMRQNYIELGEPPADVDKWIKYAEFAIESRNRDIPYREIGESISRSENMVDLYEELSTQKVDEASLQSFFTQASTLLSVINESFSSDPRIALSIQDDNLLPINDLEGEL